MSLLIRREKKVNNKTIKYKKANLKKQIKIIKKNILNNIILGINNNDDDLIYNYKIENLKENIKVINNKN